MPCAVGGNDKIIGLICKNYIFLLYLCRHYKVNKTKMKSVTLSDSELRKAAETGMDEFIGVVHGAIMKAAGGELTAESMAELNASQITLAAYIILRDEVMDGGFVQLIHNGYGGFIYLNPFAKVMKRWGLKDLSNMIYSTHTLYCKYGEEIEKDCTDEEFMAMFEKYEEFDEFDDDFVENEEDWTAMIAAYVDDHLDDFVTEITYEQQEG